MRIPLEDAIIPRDKLTLYLLVRREDDDKSKFLEQAGFTLDNADDLEQAIRDLLKNHDAVRDRVNVYGEFYRVEGELVGLNDRILEVVTIWIVKAAEDDGKYRFVTLKPAKESER